MGTDPKPMDAACHRQPERPIGKTDSDTVILAVPYSLEVQRWMHRVGLYLSVVPVREGLNVSRQCIETPSKAL